MAAAGRVDFKKAVILREEYAAFFGCEFELFLVSGRAFTGFQGGQHVDAATPQAPGYCCRRLIIQVKPNSFRQAPVTLLSGNFRALPLFQLGDMSAFLADESLYFLAMFVIIGERRVQGGQANGGMLVCDFIRGKAQFHVPDGHVLDSDASARQAGFAAAHAGRPLDARI